MAKDNRETQIQEYLDRVVRLESLAINPTLAKKARYLIEKAFDLLPDRALALFLGGKRKLVIKIMNEPVVPLGMRTQAMGSSPVSTYTIVVFQNQLEWDEDLFCGGLLRELAHVILEKPPETEWPENRKERASYIQHMEHRADAMLWKWGLRDYSVTFVTRTYPPHYADRIIVEIAHVVLRSDPDWE